MILSDWYHNWDMFLVRMNVVNSLVVFIYSASWRYLRNCHAHRCSKPVYNASQPSVFQTGINTYHNGVLDRFQGRLGSLSKGFNNYFSARWDRRLVIVLWQKGQVSLYAKKWYTCTVLGIIQFIQRLAGKIKYCFAKSADWTILKCRWSQGKWSWQVVDHRISRRNI